MSVNIQMWMYQIPVDAIYGAFGDISNPNRNRVTPESCLAKDCMHPCYGEFMLGACGKCAQHLIETKGSRHAICDLCTV